MRAILAAILMLAAPWTAHAEVIAKSDTGFQLKNEAAIPGAALEQVYTKLGEIGRWWDSAHTYSGDAANMTLELKPGGCFCEALPGGGIKHGEVVAAWPGRMLVLSAPLGPLQGEGVSGALTFTLAQGKDGVQVTQTFNVGGRQPGGVSAELVDQVVATQLARFKRYVETGSAG